MEMKKLTLIISLLVIVLAVIIFVPFRQPSFIGYVYKVDKINDVTIIVGDYNNDSAQVLIRDGATQYKSGQRVNVYYNDKEVNAVFPLSAEARLSEAEQSQEESVAVSQLFSYLSQQHDNNFYPIIHSIEQDNNQWIIVVNEKSVSSEPEQSLNRIEKYLIDDAGNVTHLETVNDFMKSALTVNGGNNVVEQVEVTPSLVHATELGKWLVEAIKQSDVSRLSQLLAAHSYDEQQLLSIIEAFHHNSNPNTLTVTANDQGSSMSPASGQYEFTLTAEGFENLPEEITKLVIQYRNDNTIMFHHPYITYYPYAESFIARYVKAIRDENDKELARILTVDDLDIPLSVAQATIYKYKEQFNLDQLEMMYDHHFYFIVYDANGEEHQIELIFGDGLVGIADSYIPVQ